MSLLSSFLIPKLEAELLAQEPAIAEFLVTQAHTLASEVMAWAQAKVPALAPGADQNAS